MKRKYAQVIRQAIKDARARKTPSYFSPTERGYDEAARHPLYWMAWERTTAKMPPPLPPKG